MARPKRRWRNPVSRRSTAAKFKGELVSKDVTLNAEVKMPDGQTAQKTLVVTIQRVEGTLDGAQRDRAADHHADPRRLTAPGRSFQLSIGSSKGLSSASSKIP